MKQFVSFFFFLILFSRVASPVSAKLWINEFSSSGSNDWVEIYNDSSLDIPLSEYRLRDSTASNKLDLNGILAPKGYMVFDWSEKLNNPGDIIRLVKADDESQEEDRVSYGDVTGKVIDAPQPGQIAARISDGGNNWGLYTADSKGSANTNSNPVPTPTPRPTDTPVPTITPSRTPTPTKSPTAGPFSTVTPTGTSQVRGVGTVRSSPTIDYDVPTPVLAERGKNTWPTIVPTEAVETKVLGTASVNPSVIAIALGVLVLLGAGGYGYYVYRKEQ